MAVVELYVPDGWVVSFPQKIDQEFDQRLLDLEGADFDTLHPLSRCWMEVHGAINAEDAHRRCYDFFGKSGWAFVYYPTHPRGPGNEFLSGQCVGRVP